MHARLEYLLKLVEDQDERLAALMRHEISLLLVRVEQQSEQIKRLREERQQAPPEKLPRRHKWW